MGTCFMDHLTSVVLSWHMRPWESNDRLTDVHYKGKKIIQLVDVVLSSCSSFEDSLGSAWPSQHEHVIHSFLQESSKWLTLDLHNTPTRDTEISVNWKRQN
jgi:hypothetical protein